jgi:hypothetical protein
MLSNASCRFNLLHSFDPACTTIHPEDGGRADVGRFKGRTAFVSLDISDGVFIFTGLLRNLIVLFFMGRTFLALFQSSDSSFSFI